MDLLAHFSSVECLIRFSVLFYLIFKTDLSTAYVVVKFSHSISMDYVSSLLGAENMPQTDWANVFSNPPCTA